MPVDDRYPKISGNIRNSARTEDRSRLGNIAPVRFPSRTNPHPISKIWLLDWPAMFAGSHFVSQILELGYNLVISPARVMILGVRQDFVNEQAQF